MYDDEERDLCTYHSNAGAEESPRCDERGCPDSRCTVGQHTAFLCLVGKPVTNTSVLSTLTTLTAADKSRFGVCGRYPPTRADKYPLVAANVYPGAVAGVI